jgi:hypothetical protein
MGWDLEKSTRVSEPEVERLEAALSEEESEDAPGMDIFRLSGGVLGSATRTSNRIDGLLAKMLANPGSGRYLGDIDKNLDYLYTSLQLDLIDRVARDVSLRKAPEVPQIVEEPRIALDRSRSSI